MDNSSGNGIKLKQSKPLHWFSYYCQYSKPEASAVNSYTWIWVSKISEIKQLVGTNSGRAGVHLKNEKIQLGSAAEGGSMTDVWEIRWVLVEGLTSGCKCSDGPNQQMTVS